MSEGLYLFNNQIYQSLSNVFFLYLQTLYVIIQQYSFNKHLLSIQLTVKHAFDKTQC